MNQRVDLFYSLQSDYCYFLSDRLIGLAGDGIDIIIRPVLGGVIRIPERYRDRDELEQAYFKIDTKRPLISSACPTPIPTPHR